jgi:hypothetical protein
MQNSMSLRVIERMQTALILEYQKSVDLQTLNHLHTWLRATGSHWII